MCILVTLGYGIMPTVSASSMSADPMALKHTDERHIIDNDKIKERLLVAKQDVVNAILTMEPSTPLAGQTTFINFHLTNHHGKPITELQVHHARILHTLIVSENLRYFMHIHPEDFDRRNNENKGIYTEQIVFPCAGRYLVAIDLVTRGGKSLHKNFYINVKGTPKMQPIAVDLRRIKYFSAHQEKGTDRYPHAIKLGDLELGNSSKYRVQLVEPKIIYAGKPVILKYRFERENKPSTNFTPFLHAPMHFAIIREGLSHGIIHAHGNEVGKPQMDHSHHHIHAGTRKSNPVLMGPLFKVTVTFPTSGLYQIIGQIKQGRQILFTHFMVKVDKR